MRAVNRRWRSVVGGRRSEKKRPKQTERGSERRSNHFAVIIMSTCSADRIMARRWRWRRRARGTMVLWCCHAALQESIVNARAGCMCAAGRNGRIHGRPVHRPPARPAKTAAQAHSQRRQAGRAQNVEQSIRKHLQLGYVPTLPLRKRAAVPTYLYGWCRHCARGPGGRQAGGWFAFRVRLHDIGERTRVRVSLRVRVNAAVAASAKI